MNDAINHQVVMIGPRQTMIGILTQPVGYEPEDQPVFVILNTGIIHRVGYHRMYVALACALAEVGYQTLRFDLSGIGDSESWGHGRSPIEGVLADVREAVEWLFTAQGARKIILVGLCSGADYSLVYGISDPRVRGLVLLDPSIPPTAQYHLRDLLRHLTRPQSWINLVMGRGRRWKNLLRLLGLVGEEARRSYWPDLNAPVLRGFLQNAYQQAMEVGMQCLIVCTSGLPHQHNYRRQICDAFPAVPFASRLRLEYFARCDHVFTLGADRERLFGIVIAWAQETCFGREAGIKPNRKEAFDLRSRERVSYEI